jgi:hypothetical protein
VTRDVPKPLSLRPEPPFHLFSDPTGLVILRSSRDVRRHAKPAPSVMGCSIAVCFLGWSFPISLSPPDRWPGKQKPQRPSRVVTAEVCLPDAIESVNPFLVHPTGRAFVLPRVQRRASSADQSEREAQLSHFDGLDPKSGSTGFLQPHRSSRRSRLLCPIAIAYVR